MHRSYNGGVDLQKKRNPMNDMTSAFNNAVSRPVRPAKNLPPSQPSHSQASTWILSDFNMESYMQDLYRDFLSSPEKQNILLLQFQTLRDKAQDENNNEHRHRCKTLEGPTVELFQHFCRELRVNHIIRMRAIELYDRFMAVYNDEIAASIAKYSYDKKEKVKQRLEKQTLLRICSCIQLAHKFHYDMNDAEVTNKTIQNFLSSKSSIFNAKAIIRSEIRVFRALNYNLHFVTSLDVIEHLIPMLHNADPPSMQKFYQLCMKILDFFYMSHQKIYMRLCKHKTFAFLLEKGFRSESVLHLLTYSLLWRHTFKSLECNVLFRSAAVLISAFILIQPNSHQDPAKKLAEICLFPEKTLIHFSSIIIDELLEK